MAEPAGRVDGNDDTITVRRSDLQVLLRLAHDSWAMPEDDVAERLSEAAGMPDGWRD